MTALVLTRPNLNALKRTLSDGFPGVKSSHLTEALAAALGRRTHATLLKDLTASDPADPEIALLDESRFLARLRDFGFEPSLDDLDFGLFSFLDEDGVALIETTPASSFEIEYNTPRKRAWRNLMVAAVNAGLDQKLFGLRPGDNRWPEHGDERRSPFVYALTFDGGLPALASVSDAGYDELSIHVALEPTQEGTRWVRCWNAGFLAGGAFAAGWLERRAGAWLQTSDTSLRCRRRLLDKVAAVQVVPKGYGDRGQIIL